LQSGQFFKNDVSQSNVMIHLNYGGAFNSSCKTIFLLNNTESPVPLHVS